MKIHVYCLQQRNSTIRTLLAITIRYSDAMYEQKSTCDQDHSLKKATHNVSLFLSSDVACVPAILVKTFTIDGAVVYTSIVIYMWKHLNVTSIHLFLESLNSFPQRAF